MSALFTAGGSQKEVRTREETKKGHKVPYCVATAGPGPAAYNLPGLVGYISHDPSKWRGPAFSVQGRGSLTKRANADIPGPKYYVRECTRFGVITTPSVKFQKGGRATIPKKEEKRVARVSDAYLVAHPHTTKGFTIAGRHYLTVKGFTPAPNQYKIPDAIGLKVPDLKRAPAYSLQSRPYMRHMQRAPGPAEYASVDVNVYKSKPPRATLTAKVKSKIGSSVPGPTAYMVNFNKCLPRAPTFAFGLKHSICAGTMKTPVDDSLNQTR